jgi:RND superfamily putative drug exporter
VLATIGLGVTLGSRTAEVLKGGGYTAGGSESVKVDQILDQEFKQSGIKDATVVFQSSQLVATDAEYRDQVTEATRRLQSLSSVRAVLNLYNTRNPGLASKDGHTSLVLVAINGDETEVQKAIPKIREQLHGVTLKHWVTGRPAVDYDVIVQSEKDLEHSELVTIPLILVLLLIVFRTVISALMPLVLGATAIALATSLVFVLGSLMPTSVFALNVGTMLGLGLSIDYALFLVSRYRDQRAAGQPPAEAIPATLATAGRSIAYSGITVILGMAALAALSWDIGLIRSIALAVLLVAAAALLASLTLVPAVLALLGDRIEWLRVLPRPKPQAAGTGFWYGFSHAVMRRPWLWLAGGVVILAVLALPVRDITLGRGGTSAHDESGDGLSVIQREFGGNAAAPIVVVVEAHSANGVWNPQFLGDLKTLTDRIRADGRVQDAVSLSTLFSALPPQQYLALNASAFKASRAGGVPVVNADGANDVALIVVLPKNETYDGRTEALVADLRGTMPATTLPSAYNAKVGGETALLVDYRDQLNQRFPFIVAAVMLLIFVILLLFFRSLVLPVKAMLLNLASVLATFGALVFVFQYGYLTNLLGFTSLKSVSAITPTVLYVVIFGLSTDYEVLMLSRVKEYFQRTGDNQEAVAAGLQRTAGVITAAALILVGTFASFATGSVIGVKEIGLGLAFGVLIDATLVRIVLVPATMRLMGAANWWVPSWLDRILPHLSEGEAPEPAAAGPTPSTPAQPAPPPAAATQATRAAALAEPGSAQLVPVHLGLANSVRLTPAHGIGVGRDSSNELCLRVKDVSRHHARIEPGARGYQLTDLHSLNGVWLNGRRIEPEVPIPLVSGDVIGFGNAEDGRFRFLVDPSAAAGTEAQILPSGEGAAKPQS